MTNEKTALAIGDVVIRENPIIGTQRVNRVEKAGETLRVVEIGRDVAQLTVRLGERRPA